MQNRSLHNYCMYTCFLRPTHLDSPNTDNHRGAIRDPHPYCNLVSSDPYKDPYPQK